MNDEYLIYGETLKSIADSIRSVSSVSTAWTPDEMAAYILANLVKPTSRQAAKTYTPSTSNQTIAKGTFLTGAATITGEPNYVEGNIKKGTKMWNKTGTLSGIWGDPSAYGFTAVKSGSFTLADWATTHSITHNLGMMPKFAMYCATNPALVTGTTYGLFLGGFVYQTCPEDVLGTSTKPSSGVFISSSFNKNSSNNYYMYANGTAGFPNIAPDNTIYTMTYTGDKTSIRNIIRSTANVMTLIPSKVNSNNGYIQSGTYNWIVMA